MIHNVTRLALPTFNNSLLDESSFYLDGDLICLQILDCNECYFYIVHSMGVFNSIADFVVNRTFSNNHKI